MLVPPPPPPPWRGGVTTRGGAFSELVRLCKEGEYVPYACVLFAIACALSYRRIFSSSAVGQMGVVVFLGVVGLLEGVVLVAPPRAGALAAAEVCEAAGADEPDWSNAMHSSAYPEYKRSIERATHLVERDSMRKCSRTLDLLHSRHGVLV